MMSTRQINMVHHVHYVVATIILLNIALRESMISMTLWKRWILVAINHNQVVFVPKGEHDDPHELTQQQELEGSTELEHMLYSHTNTITPEKNSSEKIHESGPNLVSSEIDDTLYPHINNDIEYGLFEDVIDSYYLDSQIKDDFTCDQSCYTKTQHK